MRHIVSAFAIGLAFTLIGGLVGRMAGIESERSFAVTLALIVTWYAASMIAKIRAEDKLMDDLHRRGRLRSWLIAPPECSHPDLCRWVDTTAVNDKYVTEKCLTCEGTRTKPMPAWVRLPEEEA